MVEVPTFAVIVTFVSATTGFVSMTYVAVVLPSGTTTVDGTEAAALSEVKVTVAPPARAGTSRVTVPVKVSSPLTVDELKVWLARIGVDGSTVRVAVLVTVPAFAEIVTVVVLATPTVAISKVAEVLPAGIVTVAGTVAALLLLVRDTTVPPEGAVQSRLTVPVLPAPALTWLGDRLTVPRMAG